jgi:hypothetical protein
MAFLSFHLRHVFCILPNANPGRYFSQYNWVVTDVWYQWKRDVHDTEHSLLVYWTKSYYLLIRLFIYIWIFSRIIEYNVASYNWKKWVSHKIFTLGRYLFQFLVSNYSSRNKISQFNFVLEIKVFWNLSQCRLINSYGLRSQKSWIFINTIKNT